MKDDTELKVFTELIYSTMDKYYYPWYFGLTRHVKPVDKLKPKTPYFPLRLSASSIGNKCERSIWFAYHHYARTTFPPRMLMLFNLGHTLEAIYLELLRASNVNIEMWDEETGKQWEFTAEANRFVCRLDGLLPTGVLGLPKKTILEIKTCNNRKYEKFKKKGLKQTEPKYYIQVQIAMALAKTNYAIVSYINKDTSEIRNVVINRNKHIITRTIQKIRRILKSNVTIPNGNKAECKFCDYKGLCYDGDPIYPTCHNCKFFNWNDNKCDKLDKSVKYVVLDCKSYEFKETTNEINKP